MPIARSDAILKHSHGQHLPRNAHCLHRDVVGLLAAAAAALVGLLLASDPALAQGQTVWTGSGDWWDPDRWNAGVPSSLDAAVIQSGTPKIEKLGAGAMDVTIVSGEVQVQSGGITPGLAGSLGVSRQLDVGYTGAGRLRIRTGGRVASAQANISFHQGSGGEVVVDGAGGGATWTNTGQIAVGASYPATGALNILNGGVVTSDVGLVGSGSATGIATVDNATWTSRIMTVAYGGIGHLFIQNHATVSSVAGAIGAGGSGTAMVDNATWTNSDDYHVGNSSEGTLLVANRGTFTAKNGYVGNAAGSNGTVKLDNATWTLSGALSVGNYGSGKLEINNGSTLSNTKGLLGVYDNASGSVTIDNATWTNSGELVISSGITLGRTNGTLLIRNGGSVRSTTGTVGRGATATATVTGIRAGGPPSTWTLTGDLFVGDRGPGTLTIADGGIVSTRTTYLSYHGANAALNLNGTAGARGVIETAQILNAGAATMGYSAIHFDGGVVRATANQVDFIRRFEVGDLQLDSGGVFVDSNNHDIGIAAPLLGAGPLTKLGGGTLTLTGTHGYAGVTTVEAGTLLVNGSVAGGAMVKSGATLGGAGSILGSVTVAAGAFLSPGSSAGTLTTGPLTLAQQAALVLDMGPAADLVVVNGDVALDGIVNLLGDATAIANGASVDAIRYSGALIARGLAIGTVPSGFHASEFMIDFSTPGVVRIRKAALMRARGDLTGDGRSDVFWRRSDGTNAAWIVTGNAADQFTAKFLPGVPPEWEAMAVGDVNGDGIADVVWYQPASGLVAIWLMNASASIASATFPANVGANTGWVLAAVGDTNGDGRTDLIWRNADTGQLVVWYMSSDGVIASTIDYGVVPLEWQLRGAGDFDGDRIVDLLWFHPGSGVVALWLMAANGSFEAIFPGAVGPGTWRPYRVADLDGDGFSDIFWRDEATGMTAAWYIDAAAPSPLADYDFFVSVPLADWNVGTAGDFNVDGRDDLLWYAPDTGNVVRWLMNRRHATPVVEYVASVGAGWHMLP